MFLILAAVFVVLWLMGVVFFKVARGVIHLLLLIALVAVVVHFVRAH